MYQYIFNPIDYCFEWTADGWYKWDRAIAHKSALAARNAQAKALKAQGYSVRLSTHSQQLITTGGIGSGHPQIEVIVNVYLVTVR